MQHYCQRCMNIISCLQDEKDVQAEPTMDELRQMKRAVRMNSVIRRKSGAKYNRASALSSGE